MALCNPIINLDNVPQISYFVNNQGNKDISCLNYIFQNKTIGKKSAMYVCSTKDCYASISLETEMIENNYQIKDPMVVTRINLRHKDGCLPKEEAFFEIKVFLNKVKEQIILNPLLPIQQIYEKERSISRSKY